MRITIIDFIKIFTVFFLIKLSEKQDIDLTISLIIVLISLIDWHIYDIWIKKLKKENINKYNLFIGFILFNIYNLNPTYLIWFFASWLVSELINVKT